MRRAFYFFLTLFFGMPLSAQVDARLQHAEGRVSILESRVSQLESEARNASVAGAVVFLFGTFCALWAQNTGRSAWLWFFLGLFFSVFAVLVLLAKNAADLDRQRGERREFDLQDFRRQ
jgi:hypothetical protein